MSMFRPSGRSRAVVLSALLPLVSACRYQIIWTGVEFTDDGRTLRVAAEEPFCGCLALANVSSASLHLRATLRAEPVGEATLAPGERGEWRFDWAGHQSEDLYEISGLTSDGTAVALSEATRMSAMTRWQDCASTTCTYGSLQMNLAELRGQ